MHSAAQHRFVVLPLLLLSLSLVALPGASRAADWDQATMIAIATAFHDTVKDLRATVRGLNKAGRPKQNRINVLALETLKKLETSARKLRDELAKGKGRDETYRLMRRIDLLRNDAAVLARYAMMAGHVQAKLAAAAGILEELEFYYVSSDASGDVSSDASGDE